MADDGAASRAEFPTVTTAQSVPRPDRRLKAPARASSERSSRLGQTPGQDGVFCWPRAASRPGPSLCTPRGARSHAGLGPGWTGLGCPTITTTGRTTLSLRTLPSSVASVGHLAASFATAEVTTHRCVASPFLGPADLPRLVHGAVLGGARGGCQSTVCLVRHRRTG